MYQAQEAQELRQILSDCLEIAKKLGANLQYELSEAVDMEFESTNAVAHFAKSDTSDASLNVRLLLDQLGEKTVVAATDLFPPPQTRLLIHGAMKNRNYRIIIHL